MPLLDRDAAPVEDRWLSLADDAPDADTGRPVIVGFTRWQAERETLSRRNGPLGIRLASNHAVEDIAEDLPRFQVVALDFPKFRDGRAFSQARLLRDRHGFDGEIRAAGHILPDQYLFLIRCGVSTVAVPDGADLEPWRTALTEISVGYQPALGDGASLGLLRRHIGKQ